MAVRGEFRDDLYYRLNVLKLRLPPLRERRSDIALLVRHFLSEIRPDFNQNILGQIARHPAFTSHNWPGNIRELKNIVERFSVLYIDRQQYKTLLTRLILGQDPADINPDANILNILKYFDGNRSKTHQALGISRMTLWRKLNKVK